MIHDQHRGKGIYRTERSHYKETYVHPSEPFSFICCSSSTVFAESDIQGVDIRLKTVVTESWLIFHTT